SGFAMLSFAMQRRLDRALATLPVAHRAKAIAIARWPALAPIFHEPVPNNYSFILYPRHGRIEEQIAHLAGDTRFLNVASQKVLDTYKTALQDRRILKSEEELFDPWQVIEAWELEIGRHNHFLGIDFVESFSRWLSDSGQLAPLAGKLTSDVTDL